MRFNFCTEIDYRLAFGVDHVIILEIFAPSISEDWMKPVARHFILANLLVEISVRMLISGIDEAGTL